MKNLRFLACSFVFMLVATTCAYSQIFGVDTTKCDGYGRINGIHYTSCFPWLADNDPNTSGNQPDGMVYVGSVQVKNDTLRLRRAIDATYGKLVFNESNYYVNDELNVSAFRTLIGTGRETRIDASDPDYYRPSKIVQTANGKAIFKIGGGIESVVIRDLGLTAAAGITGTIGIKAENGDTEAASYQSLDFEFSNLTFTGLDKGIFVNAQPYQPSPGSPAGFGSEGFWRFDNVTLENSKFVGCRIGVHVNSANSGWSMRNLHFNVPAGPLIPEPIYIPETETNPETFSGGITSTNVNSVTLAMYLQRIAYSTIDLAIADGPHMVTNTSASAFIYVGHHANLNIQSSIDEGFKNSIFIYGGDINGPVNLSNNTFQSTLIARNTTVMSSANQFSNFYNTTLAPAKALQGSRIYSIGDRYCLDYIPGGSVCAEPANSSGISTAMYQVDTYSKIMFNSNPYTTAVDSLRFGPLGYQYDILRDTTSGVLSFNGVQTGGYAGYKFQTPNGVVKIQNDGSVTYGSKNYADLMSGANLDPYLYGDAPDGTVIYCSNCQKTTPCSTGGTGAIAKRLNNAWDCN